MTCADSGRNTDLHARAIEVRGANGAAGDQVSVLARHGDLPRLSSNFVDALVEGASLPFSASTDMAPATTAAANTSSATDNPASASAVDTCVPLINAKTSLARSLRVRARLRASRRPRQHLARTRTSPMPSNTVLKCAKAPNLRCSHRTLCGNQRIDFMLERASKASITAMVMPECPRANA